MTRPVRRTATAADIVISIVTYRRVEDLARMLPAVLAEAGTVDRAVSLLVVDNDPSGSARDVVAAHAGDGVRYVLQPEPGIAAARNAALDAVPDDVMLIFIDDDEHPQDGWLAALLETQQATGAAAVAGAVVSEFDAPLEPWVAAGRFFDRRRLPTGTPIDVAATNNLLLDMTVVRRLGLRFDSAFGLTGGSDSLFTRSLVKSGAGMVWCNEAVVVDRVPSARLTRDWVLKRAFRTGNGQVRVALVLAGSRRERVAVRLRETWRGSVRILGGTARMVIGTLTRSLGHRARGRRTISRGAGLLAGAYGVHYAEYARPNPAQPRAEGSSAS